MIYLDEANLDYIPSTKGNDVRKFERAMAEYLGVKDCVAVNSGTSALHLALLACGIGSKDTVIVPATTFVGTANAILYNSARIKLIDIDSKTYCLSKETYKPTKKNKQILSVSLYGYKLNIPDYSLSDYVFLQSNPFKIPTYIFDFAESIHSKPILGDAYYCYSFNGNKTMTTGGGGLVVGLDLDKIRKLISPAYSDCLAYNYGMPAINARLGLQQLITLSDNIKKKEEFNRIYREELYFLKFQGGQPGPYWMTACLFPEHIDIEKLQLRLEMHDVPTRRIFKPLNHYKHLADGKTYPNAEYIYKHGLCLPSSTKNSPEDIYSVCQTIKKLI